MMRQTRLILIALLMFGCNQAPPAPQPPVGESKPQGGGDPSNLKRMNLEVATAKKKTDLVRLKTVDLPGLDQLIADKRGKVIIMDCWSMTCPPCMKEFHNLVELHHEYGPEKVACVSLSFDNEGIYSLKEVNSRVLAFLTKQRATFDNLITTEESDEVYGKLDLPSIPAVRVYDRQGTLREMVMPTDESSDVYARVRELVTALLEDDDKNP